MKKKRGQKSEAQIIAGAIRSLMIFSRGKVNRNDFVELNIEVLATAFSLLCLDVGVKEAKKTVSKIIKIKQDDVIKFMKKEGKK